MPTQPHDHRCVDSPAGRSDPVSPRSTCQADCCRCHGSRRNIVADRPHDVAVPPGVLAWSAQRGCITTPEELACAFRADEVLLHVDDDHVVRAVESDAPLVAVVRIDSDTARMAREIGELTARVEDIYIRMVDVAEGAIDTLTRR